MLCTDKGSIVQAQLLFWMVKVMVLHACSIPLFRDDQTKFMRVHFPIQYLSWLLMLVNQTQVGVDKVPFAVTRHILRNVWRGFRLQKSALATVAQKSFNGKYTEKKNDFPIEHFYVTIADADIGSLK